jgi:hypothetical protein
MKIDILFKDFNIKIIFNYYLLKGIIQSLQILKMYFYKNKNKK